MRNLNPKLKVGGRYQLSESHLWQNFLLGTGLSVQVLYKAAGLMHRAHWRGQPADAGGFLS